MFASIFGRNEVVDLTGCRFVSLASGVRFFRQQRGESFALRHDAPRFYRDETRRHRRRHS